MYVCIYVCRREIQDPKSSYHPNRTHISGGAERCWLLFTKSDITESTIDVLQITNINGRS